MYYIDGNNLQGITHGRAVGTAAAESELIRLLERYANQQSKPITLVFDGVRPQPGAKGKLRIVYPTDEDKDADHTILRLLTADPQRRNATVVTADRGLITHVRALGARVEDRASFLNRIPHQTDAETKPRIRSGGEVDAWLAEFGIPEEVADRRLEEVVPPPAPAKKGKKLR